MTTLNISSNGVSTLRRTLVSSNKIYTVNHRAKAYLVQRLYDRNGNWDSTLFKRGVARGAQWDAFVPNRVLYDELLKKCID